MTCVVGFIDRDENTIHMGGDTAGVSGLDVRSRADSKVFQKGDMLIGFTTSFRMGQLLQYVFEVPAHPKDMNAFEYLSSIFIDDLIKCLKQNHWATVDNNHITGGTFLLGYRGDLYTIYDDFQISITHTHYAACGCGENYALGALYAQEDHNTSGYRKLLKALSAAATFSGGVSPPFNILSMKGDQK